MVVAVDIGGTKMLAGLIDEGGRALATRQVRTRADAYLDDAGELVRGLLRDAADRGLAPVAVGVGTTGFVDRAGGTLQASMTLGLRDVPVARALRAAGGLPVFVDNDLHAAALGEIRFGAGRRYRDFLVINMGTGLAAGLVFGGRLYRGAANVAGELGHMSVDQRAPTCGCGLPGCLESIVVRARAGGDVPALRLGDDPAALDDPGLAYLALGIVNLVNLLNPAAIVLVGGRFTADAAAVHWLADTVRSRALERAAAALEHVGVAESGALAGLVGAAALAFEGVADEGVEVADG